MFELNGSYLKQLNQFINISYKFPNQVELYGGKKNGVFNYAVKCVIGDCMFKSPVIRIDDKSKSEIQILIKTIDDKIITFEMEHSIKIRNLKMEIQEKTKLSADQQNLLFQGEILNDDNKTIDEYQICDKSVIDIVARLRGGMQIFGKTKDGKTFSLEVLKTEKIIDVKKKIQEKTGLHPDEQKLIYKSERLQNDETIDDYEICDQSMIDVLTTMRSGRKIIQFKTTDTKTFMLDVKNSDKFIDIKYKIQYKTGLHPDEQILFYKDEILNDDEAVGAYQICEKSEINIFAKRKDEIRIFIKVSNKSIIPINIAKNSKIIDVKTKVEEQTGMQFVGNNLIYENKILHNEKYLNDYRIDDGFVISIDDDSQFFIFLEAIKSGSLKSVIDLYDIKFNQEIYTASPIHFACKQHNVEILKFLIDKKFKINSNDNGLKKPIHYACINGCVKILEELIAHNCSFEECDSYGMKPIHLSCLHGNVENVKLLIDKECNVESQDYYSSRPIHLACLAGNIDIVKLLLQRKCRIDVFDKSNKTPINIAEKQNRTDIIAILNEEISERMIENMITEFNLKCENDCKHTFCPSSLRKKSFEIGTKIGRGGYGEVYKRKISEGTQEVAIKQILIGETNSKNIEGNINSYLLNKKINHERIIKYFGAITKEENIFIFMEYMCGGSLRSKISLKSPIIFSKVIHYTIQILDGLQFLHYNKIIHRDIKPDNILLDNDGNVKLSDLGLGLLLCATDGQSKPANTFCGTIYYMAPEIINGCEYSFAADIWSLGVTVIEMTTGKLPYTDLSLPQAVMFKIGTTKTIPYQLPESSSNIKQIIDQMLISEPANRPSATDLINNLKRYV